MKLKYLFPGILLIGLMMQCKNGGNNTLQEALAIQDEAIHIGMALTDRMDSLMIADTSQENLKALGNIYIQLKNWENEMIPIPGMKHDHDHGHDTTHTAGDGHDHHEHHGHVHANPEEIAAQLTPEENKEMQIAWKASVMNFKKMVDDYTSQKK